MTTKTENGVTKKALWGVVAFYLLIAFEIAYMAGPFAVYFYGVYNPILNFFNNVPVLSGLNTFFFPHIARETTSAFLAVHEIIGVILAVAGFGAFLIGACQIYYSKFARKGAVTGGIYNHIRHPQYLSFAVCGFGLLLMWPRVINLLMFVTMLFVYYLLAKAEEQECAGKFGQSYVDYKNRTHMFVPFGLPKLPSLPASRGKGAVALVCLYLCAMTVTFFAAKGMTGYFIDSLYAVYTEDSATLSVAAIEDDKLEQIIAVAAANEEVAAVLANPENARYINYVLPTEWFSAEVPMNGVEYTRGHSSAAGYDNTQYKVIFTAVEVRGDEKGKDILTGVSEREPLCEVWVDLNTRTVTQVLEIPEDYKYKGIPVAVY